MNQSINHTTHCGTHHERKYTQMSRVLACLLAFLACLLEFFFLETENPHKRTQKKKSSRHVKGNQFGFMHSIAIFF